MKTRLQLRSFFLLLCFLCLSTATNAQINYSEGFDEDEGGWSDADFFAFFFFPCSGDNALTGEMWSFPDDEDVNIPVTVSPSLGNSNGLQATLTYSYSLIDWDTFEGVSNATNWGNFTVQYSSSPSGPWTTIQTITPANHVESDDCAVKTVNFTPPVGPVYLKITGNPNTSTTMDVLINIDDLSVVQNLDACTGTPPASSAVADQPLLCNGRAVNLSLAPAYTTSGLNFQWQSSTDGTSFTNVPTGGTSVTYTTTQATSMWYRARITCGSGTPTTSEAIHVVNSGLPCPCDVVFATAIEPITNVEFAGIENTSPAAIDGTPDVENFTDLAPAQVTQGETYEITLEGNTNDPDGDGYETYFTVFFDWNHDGDFEEENERYDIDFIVFSDGEDGVQATGDIEVPADALPGMTYMRVFKNYNEFPEAACGIDGEFGYGQVEDYLVNVSEAASIGWANLQWPATMTFNAGGSAAAYAQVWAEGVTEAAGAGAGITAWIGISPAGSNTNPNTWTTWVPATFNVQSGNNDEFMATIGSTLAPGTYYYASRFQLNGGAYVYGGYATSGGGFWDGTSNVSGVLTVTCTTAAPDADPTQTFCEGRTVADLEAEGDMIVWYSSASGGTALAATTPLVHGSVYHAAVIPTGGCESTARTAVTVDVTVTLAPDAEEEQTLCAGSTVADLQAEGADESDTILWYSAASGGTALLSTAVLADGMYYASVTPQGGCESVARTQVEVDVTITDAPGTENATQIFCNEAEFDDIDLDGDGDITWYAGATGGMPLDEETVLVSGTTYYASQTVGGCESTSRTAVTVQITVAEEPDGEQLQEISVDAAEDATIEDIEVTGSGTLTWYATEEDAENGENALDAGTVVTDGTYYVTNTFGECASEPYAVTLDVMLGNDGFAKGTFRYYPNPVKDVLTLSYDKTISGVEVFNLVGQKVIEKVVNGSEAQLDLSQLAAGTYMVKVSGENASKTIKVVKQ